MSPDLVRVRIGDQEATTTRTHAETEGIEILEDQPAVDARGRPLSPKRVGGREVKPRTSVDEEAAKKKPARKSATKSAGGETAGSTQEDAS